MSEIVKAIGQRIRKYRNKLGLSQEALAEYAGCHATYIGQIERGEKNATLETVEKIAAALHVPLAQLFEHLEGADESGRNLPLECYELLLSKGKEEQEMLYRILLSIEQYKND